MLCTCDRIVVSFAALVNQWLVWRPECVFESVGREWVGGGVLVALLIPLSVLIKRSFSSSSSSWYVFLRRVILERSEKVEGSRLCGVICVFAAVFSRACFLELCSAISIFFKDQNRPTIHVSKTHP